VWVRRKCRKTLVPLAGGKIGGRPTSRNNISFFMLKFLQFNLERLENF
jgi:hypothetical protein